MSVASAPSDQALKHFKEFAASFSDAQGPEGLPPEASQWSRGRVESMSSVAPTISGADNWCGQAAMWSVIRYWGKQAGKNDQQLIDDLYRDYGPDFLEPFVNAGTTPFRIAAGLRAYGLQATVASIPSWEAGGFMNLTNQPVWQVYRNWVENDWINKGCPAIALADSGMVGGPGFNLHWVVCSSASDKTAMVHNYLGGGYHDQPMNIDRFHEAWEVRFIPIVQIHFAVVLAHP